MNVFRTALLMTILTLLLIAIGGLIGGQDGVVFAFIFAAILNFGSYWFSDKIVLAMYRAQPIGPREAPEIYNIVSRLAQRANLPMPKIYMVPVDTPNAFATGRNPKHAVVAVTSGLMRSLSLQEIEGVLAHELAHVKNRDILIGTIAATLAGAVTMLARMASWAAMFGGGRDDEDRGGGLGFLILAIVAPLAAILIQMAISRSREYAADHDGSEISGTPLALADALRKLEMAARNRPLALNPSTAHIFIVNPLKRNFIATLFSTHPPIQKRIERLEQMAGRGNIYAK